MVDAKQYQFEDKYANIADEEVIALIKEGDKLALDYLLNKYKEVIKMKTNRFFIIGAEKEDMIQEGFCVFYNSI